MSAKYPLTETDSVAEVDLGTHALLKRGVHGIPASVGSGQGLVGDGSGGWSAVALGTQAELDAEAAARQTADTALQTSIDAKQANLAGSQDGTDAAVLLHPASAGQDGLVVKAPDANWRNEASHPYGTAQAIVVLRDQVAGDAVFPDDLVMFRVNGKGAMGLAGGMHVATGLRLPAGDPLPTYSIHVNPSVDCAGIYVDSAVVAPTLPYQQWRQTDTTQQPPYPKNVVAEVDKDGVFKANRNAEFHSKDNATPVSVVLGRAAAAEGQVGISAGNGQLIQGSVAGDMIVRAQIAGAKLHLGVAAVRVIAISDTPGLGFFNTAATSKKTVSGSRGGNAALASLLTQLAAYGLITDGSSA